MPVIAMFYGIIIRIFFRDNQQHHLPHIHAEYQGDVAVFSILDGTLLDGYIPAPKQKLVAAWIESTRMSSLRIGTWPWLAKTCFGSRGWSNAQH